MGKREKEVERERGEGDRDRYSEKERRKKELQIFKNDLVKICLRLRFSDIFIGYLDNGVIKYRF